jgi:hypothetical protein
MEDYSRLFNPNDELFCNDWSGQISSNPHSVCNNELASDLLECFLKYNEFMTNFVDFFGSIEQIKKSIKGKDDAYILQKLTLINSKVFNGDLDDITSKIIAAMNLVRSLPVKKLSIPEVKGARDSFLEHVASFADHYIEYTLELHKLLKLHLNPPDETSEDIGEKSNIKKEYNFIEGIGKLLKWKGKPGEFTKQIIELENHNIVKVVDGYIAFCNGDHYKDIIALYSYWVESRKLVPRRRVKINRTNDLHNDDQKDKLILIPQTLLVRCFKYFDDGKLKDLDAQQIGNTNQRLIPEEISERVAIFKEIFE